MQQDPSTPPRGTHSNGNGFPTTRDGETQTAGRGSARKSTLRFSDTADLMDTPPFLRCSSLCPHAEDNPVHPFLLYVHACLTFYEMHFADDHVNSRMHGTITDGCGGHDCMPTFPVE